MEIEFSKMHGNGNDFVVFDEFEKVIVSEEEKPEFVKKVCDRRFGVGGDGAIFVQKSEKADLKFRYFNSDGSEAEMCGNGIRCFARFSYERGYVDKVFKAETLAGIKELVVFPGRHFRVRVDMGFVEFDSNKIPAKESKKEKGVWFSEIEGFKVYAVNTGVPHAVVLVDCNELDNIKINIAKKIRYNEIFPEGTNVNFACYDSGVIRVRTYERGVEDETLSCGTGSVAVAAVLYKLGICGSKVKVITRGGELEIEFKEKFKAYMTGKATRVFDGVLKELG